MKRFGKMMIALILGILIMMSSFSASGAIGPFLIGDVDRDYEVTIVDVTYIQRYLASMMELSKLQLFAGDVDGDSSTTILDATCIQKKLAGLPSGFYENIVYGVYPQIFNFYANFDSEKAMAGVAVTFGAVAEGKDPVTYEFTVDGKVVQARSESSECTYTFPAAGSYKVAVIVYNSIDDTSKHEIDYEVVEPYDIDSPVIAGTYFDSFQNRNSSCIVTVNAIGGTAPYQYQYTLYGEDDIDTDLGDYHVIHDKTDGAILVQPYSGKNITHVPTMSLTYNKDFVLKIEVKDSSGAVAEPVYLPFNNSDVPG